MISRMEARLRTTKTHQRGKCIYVFLYFLQGFTKSVHSALWSSVMALEAVRKSPTLSFRTRSGILLKS